MNLRNCFLSLLAFSLATALTAVPASAQTRVGEAAVVKNEVLRVAASSTTQIKVGDGLVRDEIVRTGLDSATRLVMADSTNLSLGPNATLKLDRTVFDDSTHYRDIAVRLTSGAFRFVTGNSDKAAYKITTPLATIGVRGTTLDILSQRGQTIVNLQAWRSLGLHGQLRMHPAHQARRHRHHHFQRRRQVDDQEDQQPAVDVCRDLQRRCGALQHYAICGCVTGHRR